MENVKAAIKFLGRREIMLLGMILGTIFATFELLAIGKMFYQVFTLIF